MLIFFSNAFQQLQPSGWVVLSLFALFFVLNACYIFLFTGRVAWLKKPSQAELAPLSVLLALRNEEENLRKNLPGILSAEDFDYEVVVVDDFSHDNSLTILGALKRQEPKLRFSSLNQETRYSEKMARNIALKSARHDWVMLISPSTSKVGTHWPGGIMSRMNGPAEVVIGYSNVEPGAHFFNLICRLELFFQQLKSFGFILNGLPYVVSEENVAFKKQKYFDGDGFRGKVTEPYVNLELVINAFIRKATVCLLLSGETSVYRSEPNPGNNFFELLKKETRLMEHLSLTKRTLLVFFEWVKLLFLPLSVFMLVTLPAFWPVVITSVILLASVHAFIIKVIQNRLDEGKLFLSSLLFALIWPYFKLVFRAGYNYSRRKKRWKEKK